MAGRPAYCRCRGDFDSRWHFDFRGNVRCKNCNGAAPHNLVERARTAAVTNTSTPKPAPASAPAPAPQATEEKQESLRKTAAVLNAKKEKDEAAEATTKTRKVGKAKVNSKMPAKTGGIVTGQTGQGYIFADEPEKIYVVGDGWFGSWELKEVTYTEPVEKGAPGPTFAPGEADTVITSINDWNNQGASLVSPIRTLKTIMKAENVVPADGFFASEQCNTVDCYGFRDGAIIGVWRKTDATTVKWAVVPPMWDIL